MRKRTKIGAIPVPDKDAELKPGDFSAVLEAVPAECVLIGGQAVAWWAGRYGIKAVVEGREQECGFQVLSAVPIDSIRREARHGNPEDRQKLQRFLSLHWPKVIASGQTDPMEQ
jgi:hypothetical protein